MPLGMQLETAAEGAAVTKLREVIARASNVEIMMRVGNCENEDLRLKLRIILYQFALHGGEDCPYKMTDSGGN